MHFDSFGSEQHPSTGTNEFTGEDAVERSARGGESLSGLDRLGGSRSGVGGADPYSDESDEDDEDEEEPELPPKVREGLPSRFRMRHTPHYVDALLGDAPLKTVREIPVAEIEPPLDDLAELDELERSIRSFGVIEPLLVGRRGSSYRVIAGMRRLRAAQRIGLDTVPCLVHDVDEERFADLRSAATHRVTIPPPPAPEPEPQAQAPAPSSPEMPQTAIGEAVLGLEFVTALLPAMNAAGGDRLRWGVLTDLASIELSHAKMAGTARDILARTRPLDRTSVDYQALVSDVVSAIGPEARLRNVRIDVSLPDGEAGRDIFLDRTLCCDALTGLLQSLLALAPRAGTVLTVTAQITSIRPALIVQCALSETDPELGPEAFARFFDASWREHPSGPNGAPMCGAFAAVARAHGGRVDVKPVATGCQVTFVAPRIDG